MLVRVEVIPRMGIGTSIFLIAVGAILKFAVTASVSGIELATVGVILMVVGVIGLLISLFLIATARDRRTTVRDPWSTAPDVTDEARAERARRRLPHLASPGCRRAPAPLDDLPAADDEVRARRSPPGVTVRARAHRSTGTAR